MSSPYSTFPDSAYWRRSVSSVDPQNLDPLLDTKLPFRIEPADKVMTAGSCFAQHIARYLTAARFDVLVTERAHPVMTPKTAQAFNYGVFTARYGNIYTARQLLQLLHRVYGKFEPQEDVWERGGCFIDPFRPNIQPGGFATIQEYHADRKQHFTAVRRAFEKLHVLVFTLGLTEAWRSRADGAVYPLCPGVAGGTFDESRHEFHNFTAAEVTADVLAFIDALREINRRAKVLLTVSPVPLVATAEPRHVLVSTIYSKSVLRVACEQICAARDAVMYFPSYEIITGPCARGAYFGPDAREVTEQGVAHVMRTFFRHLTDHVGEIAPIGEAPAVATPDKHLTQMTAAVAAMCDEELLDADRPQADERRAGRRARRRAREQRVGRGKPRRNRRQRNLVENAAGE